MRRLNAEGCDIERGLLKLPEQDWKQAKKKGRKPIDPSLPREIIIHDIPEEDKTCKCGAKLIKIGEDITENLKIIPLQYIVIRHVYPKYVCEKCNCRNCEEGSSIIKQASPPTSLFPKSIVTPSLLAYIVVSKFVDAIPHYRLAKMFKRWGLDLSRQDMSLWVIKAGKACMKLVELLKQKIRTGPITNIDETTVQVMGETDRANTRKSYIWIFRGGDPEKPSIVYEYHPTRSGSVPLTFLKGYEGYVQTDGYSGYDELSKQPGIKMVGCLAHIRRKFIDHMKASEGPQSETEALRYISKLYAVERKADDQKKNYEERRKLREEESRKILNDFKKWLLEKVEQTPPQSTLGKAVKYALNQWDRVVRYLEDGRLRPDNNQSENAIRPVVLGRKNWMIFGDPSGANAGAVLYSLVETAKANGLDPYWYLRELFERLPLAETEEEMKALLPHCIKLPC